MTKKRTISVLLALSLLVLMATQTVAAFDLDPGPGGGAPTSTKYINTMSAERKESMTIKLGPRRIAQTWMGFKVSELTLVYTKDAAGYHFTSFKLSFSASWDSKWLNGLDLHVFLQWGNNPLDDAWGHSYDLQLDELSNGETETVSQQLSYTSSTWTTPNFRITFKANNGFDQKWYQLDSKFKISGPGIKWSEYYDVFSAQDWGALIAMSVDIDFIRLIISIIAS